MSKKNFLTIKHFAKEAKATGCLVTAPDGEIVKEFYEEKEALICFDVDKTFLEKYHTPQPGMRYQYYPSKENRDFMNRYIKQKEPDQKFPIRLFLYSYKLD